MRRALGGLASFAVIALVPVATAVAASENATDAKRAFARTVEPISAQAVTGNLRGDVGKHVRFTCAVVTIVDRGSIVGQCGETYEPVDLYVHLSTAGLKQGDRLRVLGEMEPPSMWVDITGHTWYTGFVRARYVDRL